MLPRNGHTNGLVAKDVMMMMMGLAYICSYQSKNINNTEITH